MKFNVMVFWVMTLCIDMVGHQFFVESCCLPEARWRQKNHGSPKRCCHITSLHGVITQKTMTWICSYIVCFTF